MPNISNFQCQFTKVYGDLSSLLNEDGTLINTKLKMLYVMGSKVTASEETKQKL